MTPLVTAAALMNAAMVSASAMSTIVVAELVGPGAGGLPNTAAVLGTAAGAVLIGRLTQILGRAAALRTGYAASAAGAALTVASVLSGQLVWLFAGMLLLGAGNAAGLLSRYAAADLVVPSHRARAMGTVVWAGTAGAVVGPLLLEPAQRTAAGLGMPPTVGPFLVAVVATVGAGVAISRFRRPAVDPRPYDAGPVVPNRRTNDLPVPLAGAVMVVAQIVMVAVMTAVPVHAHHHGHGLVLLGVLLSGHTFGMFALGYGWNLSYVSGSAALSRVGDTTGAPHRTGLEGPRLESLVEAWAWTASAVATALSTWLFSTGGFPLLAVIGLSLLVPVLVALTARRPTPIPVDGD